MLKLAEEIKSDLLSLEAIDFTFAAEVSKYSTMKAVAFGHIALVKSEDALSLLVQKFNQYNIDYKMIGWGANYVLPEELDYFLIKLDFPFDRQGVDSSREHFIFPASVSLHQLTSLASKFGFKGWEVFTGIPASLGGAVVMNAGTSLGEIGRLVKRVWLMNKMGVVREVEIQEDSFSYRKNHFIGTDDIVIKVELGHEGLSDEVAAIIKKYMTMRQETQPLREKTCGCMFKNQQVNNVTCPAGQYLDIMGMKDARVEGFRVNPKHANFLENYQEGSRTGLTSALKFISHELKCQYGVQFEEEIRY